MNQVRNFEAVHFDCDWLGWEVPGLHMLMKSRGNHLVGVCLNGSHSAEIKSVKISSGGSGGILAKFAPAKISRYTVLSSEATLAVYGSMFLQYSFMQVK